MRGAQYTYTELIVVPLFMNISCFDRTRLIRVAFRDSVVRLRLFYLHDNILLRHLNRLASLNNVCRLCFHNIHILFNSHTHTLSMAYDKAKERYLVNSITQNYLNEHFVTIRCKLLIHIIQTSYLLPKSTSSSPKHSFYRQKIHNSHDFVRGNGGVMWACTHWFMGSQPCGNRKS